MKYLLVVLIALAIAFGFMIKHSNDKRAALAAEKMAYEQKKEADKQAVIAQENAKSSKKQVDKQIAELQTKMTIDYLDAKKIIESDKMSEAQVRFYTNFGGRWSDALKLASSTGRIALAQPVKDLQALKREFEQHQPSNFCEQQMYENLSQSYDHTITGFLDFMTNKEYSTEYEAKKAAEKQAIANTLFSYCS